MFLRLHNKRPQAIETALRNLDTNTEEMVSIKAEGYKDCHFLELTTDAMIKIQKRIFRMEVLDSRQVNRLRELGLLPKVPADNAGDLVMSASKS
jgi:hypothetical protein